MSLVLAAVPVAADDESTGSESVPSSVGSAALEDATIAFQTIRCPDFESVRGNTGSDGDATDGGYLRYGSTVGSNEIIQVYGSAPDRCAFHDAFLDFAVSIGPSAAALSSTTGEIDATGTSTTTVSDLFGNVIETGTLNLQIRAGALPSDASFGALQCYDDAVNPDNLEIVTVDVDEPFACVLFIVDAPETPAEDVEDEVEEEQPTAPPVVVAPDTQVLGDQQVVVERDGQTVTASGPGDGDLRVVFGADEDASTDAAVTAACDVLVDDAAGPVRLAPNVVVIDPSGFADGDEIEVATLIPAVDVERAADWATIPTGDLQVGPVPRDAIFVTVEQILDRLNRVRVNRDLPDDAQSDAIWVDRILGGSAVIGDARTAISAKAAYWAADAYGVCFAGEKADVGSLTSLPPLDGTALFGPVLLSVCTEETGAPCIDDRTKDDEGNVLIEYRIPAEDPWMR